MSLIQKLKELYPQVTSQQKMSVELFNDGLEITLSFPDAIIVTGCYNKTIKLADVFGTTNITTQWYFNTKILIVTVKNLGVDVSELKGFQKKDLYKEEIYATDLEWLEYIYNEADWHFDELREEFERKTGKKIPKSFIETDIEEDYDLDCDENFPDWREYWQEIDA